MRKRAILREHARERQAWAAERARLIDQILHLSGKPWTPAPADTRPEPTVVPVRWTAVPEQDVIL